MLNLAAFCTHHF